MRAFWEKLPALRLPWMLTSCGGPFTADLSHEVVSTELVRADSFAPSQISGDLLLRAPEPADQKGANGVGKDRDGDRPDPGVQLNPAFFINEPAVHMSPCKKCHTTSACRIHFTIPDMRLAACIYTSTISSTWTFRLPCSRCLSR